MHVHQEGPRKQHGSYAYAQGTGSRPSPGSGPPLGTLGGSRSCGARSQPPAPPACSSAPRLHWISSHQASGDPAGCLVRVTSSRALPRAGAALLECHQGGELTTLQGTPILTPLLVQMPPAELRAASLQRSSSAPQVLLRPCPRPSLCTAQGRPGAADLAKPAKQNLSQPEASSVF